MFEPRHLPVRTTLVVVLLFLVLLGSVVWIDRSGHAANAKNAAHDNGVSSGKTFSTNFSRTSAQPVTVLDREGLLATTTTRSYALFALPTFTVDGVNDLSVSVTDAPDPVVLGDNLTYTISIINNGPDTASGVVVTDTLPASVSLVSAATPQGGCSGTSVVTCNLVDLAAAGTATVTIIVTPQAAGVISNTASVASAGSDPNTANNSATQVSTISTFDACSALSYKLPPTNVAAGTAARSVVVGDFNSDGKLDLGVANSGSTANSVSILVGDGAGNFTPAAGSPVGTGTSTLPYHIAAGDLNNDGKLDLVTANKSNGTSNISVLLGNGAGGFVRTNFTAAGGSTKPQFVAVRDFNADNHLDLAVANETTSNVSILLGNGTGTFNAPLTNNNPPINIATGSQPISIAVSDFNGDNKPDLAVANRGAGALDSLSILLGDGTGNFVRTPVNDIAAGGTPFYVAAGDLNGDGHPDLAVATQPAGGERKVAILLGNGAGGFGPATPFTLGNSTAVPAGLAIRDLNGDGKLDVAVARTTSNNVSVLLGNGTGGLGTVSHFNIAPGGTSSQSVAIGDFDGDTRLDLVSANSGTNNVSVLISTCSLADLTLTKTHNGSFNTSYNGVYNLTVNNIGTGGSSGSITVTDSLPAGLTFASFGGTDWNCSAVGQDVTCTNSGRIAAGASSTVTLTVSIGDSAAPSVTNTASVVNSSDTNAANNSATDPTSVNRSPVADSQTLTTDEDVAIPITLVATDPDFGTLTYGVVTPPAHGILSGSGANLTYSPNANFNGSDSFTFKANDGQADSNTATVAVTVNPINDVPVANNDGYNVAEDTTLNIAAPGVLGNDINVDSETLSALKVTDPANGSVILNADGSFTYTPSESFTGIDQFTYKANDGTFDSNTATITITVSTFNDPPVANNQSVSTNEDTGQAITLTASDVDNLELTYVVLSSPANGTLSGTAPNLTYTPNLNFNGSDSFTFKASDGENDSNTATVSITVVGVNDPPVAVNDSYTPQPATTLTVATPGVLGNDSDIEGTPLSAVLISGPANSTAFTLNTDGSFSYTPVSSFSGTDSFTYLANDGSDNSNTATVTITINPVVDMSIIKADSVDPATVGNNLTYTLTATNNGPSNATNVVVTDALPPSVVFVSATPTQGVCSGTSTVTCNLGVIAATASATINLVVTPATPDSLTNTASVSNPEPDPNSPNNSDTESTAITVDQCSTPSFAPPTNYVAGAKPSAVAVGDFNIDGKADFVTANGITAGTTTVSVRLNNGAGGFGAFTNFTVGTLPRAVVVGDFNGDNKLDLATANRASSNVSILLGNGSGGFGAATHFPVGGSPVSLAMGDFNFDGKTDLVTANESSSANSVSIILGDGAGGFGSSTHFLVGAAPDFVAVGDFNGDTNLDVAAANANTDNVSILLGNGAGSFGSATNFAVGDKPSSIVARDFNGDLLLDLAVTNLGSNNLSILMGNGTGSFGPAATIAVGASPRSIAASDINNDGNLDLVIANFGNNNVTTLVGDGAGGFGDVDTFGVGTAPYSVAISDFSGDGRLDLAVANSVSQNVSVLVNACNSPDISLAKSHNGSFNVGTEGTYTLTLTNVGGGSTFGAITVTDTLPAGLTYVSATGTDWSCSASGQTVTCTSSSAIAASASTEITLTVAVSTAAAPSTVAATVTNTATLSNISDLNSGNNSASDPTTVHPVTDLSLTKTGPTRVAVGNNVTYQVGVVNNGPSNGSGVVVTDPLPAGLNFVSAVSTRGTCSFASGTVTCNVGAMNNAISATITIVANATAAATGTLTNTASVTGAQVDLNLNNNSATQEATVGAGADLAVSKGASPSATVVAGQNITYTISVLNSGEVATSVVVTDNLPANTSFFSCVSTGGGICGGSANNRTITFASIPDGGSASITLVTTVSPLVGNNTVLSNTATVSSSIPDPHPENNSSTATVTALAPISTLTTPSYTPSGQPELLYQDQIITTRSEPLLATVTNQGSAPLIFSSFVLEGNNPDQFIISSNTCAGPGGVAPGGSCTIGVQFAPTALAGRKATLKLFHNAASSPQSVFLTGDGISFTAAAWGSNNSGQLGNNTTVNSSSPVQISGMPAGSVFAAGGHSLGLKPDGTVWAWGSNNTGQLGDGTSVRRLIPVQVGGGLNSVILIAAGTDHSLALKSNGTVWAWGKNSDGQLGDGTTTKRTLPVQVVGLTNVVAIAGRASHSLAVKSDGTVWAWGNNASGQLGDGTTTKRLLPVQVGGGLNGVSKVATGSKHSLALKQDGTVWAWGNNSAGELGDGTSTKRLLPVPVLTLTAVNAISAGGTHSLALKSDQTLWAWGGNNNGQLGNGTTVKSLVPIQTATIRIAIAAGINHSLSIRASDHRVTATGLNSAGQLGNGATTNSTTWVQALNFLNVATIAAGDNHSLGAVAAP